MSSYYTYLYIDPCIHPLIVFLSATAQLPSPAQAKMREELMKKFAEDDRLEQVSEHKRRMKAPAAADLRAGLNLVRHIE